MYLLGFQSRNISRAPRPRFSGTEKIPKCSHADASRKKFLYSSEYKGAEVGGGCFWKGRGSLARVCISRVGEEGVCLER